MATAMQTDEEFYRERIAAFRELRAALTRILVRAIPDRFPLTALQVIQCQSLAEQAEEHHTQMLRECQKTKGARA